MAKMNAEPVLEDTDNNELDEDTSHQDDNEPQTKSESDDEAITF